MNIENLKYDNELNLRLQQRNIPSNSLKPMFDFRPTPTKYTLFHTVNEPREEISSVPLNSYKEYIPTNVFNPGQKAPIDYYIKSIDQESMLQNRFMALQKSDQSVFVPKSTSQIYNYGMSNNNKTNYQKVDIESRRPKYILEEKQFFNNTRLKRTN
jgi:hypothetical protein